MQRSISNGLGKLTPAMWRDIAGLVELVEGSGKQMQALLRRRARHVHQGVRIILAKITGATADPRAQHGDFSAFVDEFKNRWVYDWQQYVPKPDDSDRFVRAGQEAGTWDRTYLWGSYSGSDIGMGPAYNLMEQNNREAGELVDNDTGAFQQPNTDTVASAPGYPLRTGEYGQSTNTKGNFLMPNDWNVQPIDGDPIVVMYLVRTQVQNEYDVSGLAEGNSLKFNVVPCFQLTNALGRAYYVGGGRGDTCDE